MSIIDSPDGQYANVSAGALLMTVPANQISTGRLALPPNISILTVYNHGANVPATNLCSCDGLDSNILYIGVIIASSAGINGNVARVFQVSPQADSAVDISFQTAPTGVWTVVGYTSANFVGKVQ